MIGIGGALEVFQVTRNARRSGQAVVVVDVTIRALARRHRVRSRQRESGSAVVERRIGPGTGAVALLAGLRET